MKKILIIEDDQVVSSIYRNKYQMGGFSVEIAKDGEEGLVKLEAFQPDIVQLDLMMPKLNGVEVIKRIRAHPKFATLPVVVLSNSYLAHMVTEAWQAGANRCISKADCTPKTMMEIVDRLLEQKGGALIPSASVPMLAAAPVLPVAAGSVGHNVGGSQTASTAADVEFQAELRAAFVDGSRETMNTIRALLHNFLKATTSETRVATLGDLLRKVRSLTGNAGMAGAQRLAKMASAIEAFLSELQMKPEQITPSTLRTVAQSVDFIDELFKHCGPAESGQLPNSSILVVDDDSISRKAVVYALEKVGLKSLNLDEPNSALAILSSNTFELIFLDVEMPGMSGFELCQKIRALPAHAKTPVVFVTGLTDFDSRTKSMLSGGNDFIAKPFIFLELGVKALIHVFRSQLKGAVPST
jgi:DNA-binding response OmpR family regulator